MATPAQFQAAREPPKKCATHGLSRSGESLHTGGPLTARPSARVVTAIKSLPPRLGSVW